MLATKRALLAIGLVSIVCGSAAAQESPSWWSNWKKDYHRNHCWPDPFVAGDRAAVMTPFQIMAANGWRRQNMLADYHFVDGETTLNQAGEHRLWFIATQAPPQRRMVFVQRGPNDEITAERMAAAEQALAKIVPRGPMPQILETNLDSGGWSGDDADATLKGFDKTRPDPRMPQGTPGAISSN